MTSGKQRQLKIVLCGYGALGLALLEGLLQAQEEGVCQVLAVYRWSDRVAPGMIKTPEHFLESEEIALGKLCHTQSISRLTGDGLNGYRFSVELLQLQPEVVLIGSWGEILLPHLLNVPQSGTHPLFINCHPSLLPAHRGANPYASVILAGEVQTGVSFHRIVEAIDAGPLILQAPIAMDETDTGSMIRDRCAEKAKALIPELLIRLQPFFETDQALPEQAQDEQAASLYYAPLPKTAQINWQTDSQTLSRFIRARIPWATAYSPMYWGLFRLYFGPSYLVSVEDAQVSQPIRPSGTILHHSKKGPLLIATQDPTLRLQVDNVRIALRSYRFPDWFNKIFNVLLLRAGLQL
jgi:methionyl-tRNA formyltransferase